MRIIEKGVRGQTKIIWVRIEREIYLRLKLRNVKISQ